MNTLVLGLDGGGTKTRLVIAQPDGEVVHAGIGPGINPMDNPNWRDDLEQLLRGAASIIPRLQFAVLGLPGYDEVRSVTAAVDDFVHRLLPVPHRNENDVRVALDGAFLDQPGTLVLAGTGSMVMAKDIKGNVIRVGGWGELFGDEGSGYWIGEEALRRASQAIDGRSEAQPFAEALLTEIGAGADGRHDALMGWCLSREHLRSEIAGLARFVDRLANKGNPTAVAILEAAAEELASQLKAAQRLSPQVGRAWSAAGSVFESRTVVDRMIAINGPLTRAALPPVGGAVWSALREADIQPVPTFKETLTSALARSCVP